MKKSVEERLGYLERRTMTLYHRTYAVTMRADRAKRGRAEGYARRGKALKKISERMDKYFRVLGILCSNLSKGKRIVLLTPVEQMRFKKWLREHPGYGPRKSKSKLVGEG